MKNLILAAACAASVAVSGVAFANYSTMMGPNIQNVSSTALVMFQSEKPGCYYQFPSTQIAPKSVVALKHTSGNNMSCTATFVTVGSHTPVCIVSTDISGMINAKGLNNPNNCTVLGQSVVISSAAS